MKMYTKAFVLFVATALLCVARESGWGQWRKASEHPILWYRVRYNEYNESAARQRKPPHVWDIEVENRGGKPVSADVGVGDRESSESYSHMQRLDLAPGESEVAPLFFTNTGPGGMVRVFFDDFRVEE